MTNYNAAVVTKNRLCFVTGSRIACERVVNVDKFRADLCIEVDNKRIPRTDTLMP